ncbi:hypothetical protein V1525DRAFT_406451 [Lipomyces kononenkoae]|uniref:Uncharacterized protein n=1 Tax=Lipomyces kononenkoae TaxID=34357 RepID=A0ACC3SYB6_LIPKO
MSPKVIVVTGTSSGIGLALATQFSNRGDTVIATVRSKAKAAGTAIEHSSNVQFVEMDALDYKTVDSAVAEIERIAPDGVDEVWNNLGVAKLRGPERDEASVESIDPVELETYFKVNAVTPAYFTSKLVPLLAKRDGKKIVFISSGIASIEVNKAREEVFKSVGVIPGYSASKSGLNMLGWYFYSQLRSLGFTVVPLHPGLVITNMYSGGEIQIPAITAEESASKVRDVVDKLTATDDYLLRSYDGSTFPW